MYGIKCYRVILVVTMLLLSSVISAEQRWTAKTEAGKFSLSIYPQAGRYQIGNYHSWIIQVKDNKSKTVSDAQLSFSGGMIGHGHGMPSEPSIKPLGEGKYLMEGVLFSMAGEWTFYFLVQTPDLQDRARFDIHLKF